MTVADDEAAALGQANYQEFSRELSRASGRDGEIVETDGLLLHAARTPFPVLFNGVWRLDPTVPAEAVVEAADAFFAERGRGWSVCLRDGVAEDEDLRLAAEDAGVTSLLEAPEMICEAPVVPRPLPDGAALRWVDDRATLDDFVAVSDAAYATQGLPPGTVVDSVTDLRACVAPHLQTVVAYDGDAPVAAAQVLMSHSIGGVYWVGTVDGARGKGLGDCVTRAVTNRAFELGARFVSLQASAMGEPIYRRMGYRELYRYRTHVRFAPPND